MKNKEWSQILRKVERKGVSRSGSGVMKGMGMGMFNRHLLRRP